MHIAGPEYEGETAMTTTTDNVDEKLGRAVLEHLYTNIDAPRWSYWKKKEIGCLYDLCSLRNRQK